MNRDRVPDKNRAQDEREDNGDEGIFGLDFAVEEALAEAFSKRVSDMFSALCLDLGSANPGTSPAAYKRFDDGLLIAMQALTTARASLEALSEKPAGAEPDDVYRARVLLAVGANDQRRVDVIAAAGPKLDELGKLYKVERKPDPDAPIPEKAAEGLEPDDAYRARLLEVVSANDPNRADVTAAGGAKLDEFGAIYNNKRNAPPLAAASGVQV